NSAKHYEESRDHHEQSRYQVARRDVNRIVQIRALRGQTYGDHRERRKKARSSGLVPSLGPKQHGLTRDHESIPPSAANEISPLDFCADGHSLLGSKVRRVIIKILMSARTDQFSM